MIINSKKAPADALGLSSDIVVSVVKTLTTRPSLETIDNWFQVVSTAVQTNIGVEADANKL